MPMKETRLALSEMERLQRCPLSPAIGPPYFHVPVLSKIHCVTMKVRQTNQNIKSAMRFS